MIPTVEQCYQFMEKYKMPDNIREHSIVVEKISRLLAQRINESGTSNLSLPKITAGALLHDIGKMQGINMGESFAKNHADMGRKICLDNNLNEITDIVGEHIRLIKYDPHSDITEKEIVYYADKRVNHDVIVGLEERLDYLLDRYGNDDQFRCHMIRKNMETCAKVEKKLFSHISFSPNDLTSIIEKMDE